MKKQWAAGLLAALALTCGLSGGFSAQVECSQPTSCFVWDGAGVLTTEEEETLDEQILETAQDIDMNVLVYLSGEHSSSESESWERAAALCLKQFGEDSDSVVYYMDLSGAGDTSYTPRDSIYTRGWAQFYYTNSEDDNRIESIFTELDPYLPRGGEDPYRATLKFCDLLQTYYEEGIPDGYYVHQDDKKGTDEEYIYIDDDGNMVYSDRPPYKMGAWALIGVLIGLISAVIAFFVIKCRYRFKTAPSTLTYTDSENIHFLKREDIFLRQYTIRRRIERDHDSDFGGGGGGHSFGGGGGGGHSR